MSMLADLTVLFWPSGFESHVFTMIVSPFKQEHSESAYLYQGPTCAILLMNTVIKHSVKIY